MRRTLGLCVFGLLSLGPAFSQSLGNAGTIEGTVADPSGSVVAKAAVSIHNPMTGYKQSTTTDKDGAFRLVNIPPNPYHLSVAVPGFEVYSQDIDVRNSVPIKVQASLVLAGEKTSVTVESTGADMLELTS